MRWKIGVISDTHNLLRESAVLALEGVDHIIHAGDIGSRDILTELKQIAPVTAVRGNIDKEEWAEGLPVTEAAVFGDSYLYVLHDRKQLDLDPWEGGCRAVISGHTHQPACEMQDGVLFLNPGSAGPRRFKLPVTLALLEFTETKITPQIINLES